MNFKYILILYFIVIFLTSCRKENRFDCVKGVGNNASVQREIGDFRIITIKDPFQVYLIQDTFNRVEIIGGENLLQSVTTEVDNDNNELIIRNRNLCNWTRNYKKSIISLNIYFKKVDIIYISGECDVFSKDTIKFKDLRIDFASTGTIDIKVKGNEFYFWQTGNGDFTISGEAGYYFIGSLASGNIYSTNLISHFVDVTCRSTTNCYVFTDNVLNVLELGYGDIYYNGNPPKIYVKTIVGDGKLIQN